MSGKQLAIVLALIQLVIPKVYGGGCQPRKYNSDSFVCVCDEQYCDTLEPVGDFTAGTVRVYESGQSGKRLNSTVIPFNNTIPEILDSETINIELNPTVKYQDILGFGGAFTDSAGINIASLPEGLQDTLINSYYSAQGSEYDMGRIPIASCDFSTREYSYADTENDFTLDHFQLAEEDHKFKIPYILKAKAASSKEINFFASPWSSPSWMKTNNKMHGSGTLKPSPDRKYHKTYANYLVKFLQEYERQGIPLWGLTAENEPFNGFVPFFPFQALGFTGISQREFVIQELGPALQEAGYGPNKLKLMILDDQRIFMKLFVHEILSNETAEQYVSGIAFHWYYNGISPPSVLDEVHSDFPNMFLLPTEASEGSNPLDFHKVFLGDWTRAENYAKDILEDLNHWSVGWVDWNLALDLQGGPNWASNFVDSTIIVNATGKEFYKQPMYYALAHFSKFLPRGSSRISLTTDTTSSSIDIGAFLRPDGASVVIVLNRKSSDINLKITDPNYGSFYNVLPARSMQSYIWK